MDRIDPNEFMDELIFCLKQEDVVKAKALLQFASDANIDVAIQQKALLELGKAPESIAFPLLEYFLKIDITNNEINESIYELILDKSYGRTDLVIKYINQEHKKSRLVYLQAVGDLMLLDAAPELARILTQETDKEVLLATVKALGALRLAQYLPAIAALMANPDIEIKHSCVYAIADMGDNNAVDQLFKVITGKDESDIVAIEALSEIQDQYALNCLASLLESSHTHIRDAAIDQLIRIGKKAVPTLTTATKSAKTDYMIHLVTTIGYIGDQSALPTILDIINIKPKDANIRQALYEALERLPSPKSAISLAGGLGDTVEAVRMSAARAVDKNLSKVLVAGLKNIVRQENEEARWAVAALIDAEADNIFNFLLEEESFVNLARDHVTTKADPATRAHFLELLKSKDREDIARSIEESITGEDTKPEECPLNIYVVDDSRMMLKLYQNKLTKLGYNPTVFEFPEEAVSAFFVQKPDLIITDLNMPKINGIQLTREIRRKYTSQQLPIIMITTQSDFIQIEDSDNKSERIDDNYLNRSGINMVLHKPFTDEQLETAINKYLKK